MAKRHVLHHEAWTEHTKKLARLEMGDKVFIQNQVGHNPRRWERTGTVMERRDHDQYAVKVDGTGRITLRNRKFLQKLEQIPKPAPLVPSAPAKTFLQDTLDQLPTLPHESDPQHPALPINDHHHLVTRPASPAPRHASPARPTPSPRHASPAPTPAPSPAELTPPSPTRPQRTRKPNPMFNPDTWRPRLSRYQIHKLLQRSPERWRQVS